MIHLPLENYTDGRGARHVSVDADSETGAVLLDIEPEHAETFDDRPIHRSILPAEARALAAMLRHYADEAER